MTDETGLPEPMTNDQIAEMIDCMTADEAPMDVIEMVAGRVAMRLLRN
jgi:hypothetical protein